MISCEPTTDLMEETDSTGAEVTLYLRRISLADVLGSFIRMNPSHAELLWKNIWIYICILYHSFLIEMTQVLGTKPLSEPMMTYCQLDHKEHISVKCHLIFICFCIRKSTWKCRQQKAAILSLRQCVKWSFLASLQSSRTSSFISKYLSFMCIWCYLFKIVELLWNIKPISCYLFNIMGNLISFKDMVKILH